MSSFLFLVIFLINIITLTAVFYLFKQIQLLKDEKSNDFTEVTKTFLKEIREENERLQKNVLMHSTQEVDQSDYLSSLNIQPENNVHNTEITNQTAANKDHLDVTNIDDHFETSLQANVLHLHNQGQSTEKIAKQLNCGTTEASLIIKFHGKNNRKA